MMRANLLALLLSTLTLCGMSSRYAINVLQRNAHPVSFQLKDPNASGDSGVQVSAFLVVRRNETGKWDYKAPTWSFDLSPGQARPPTQVIYGHVPIGFKETTKATPLERGVRYLAMGTSPGSGGSVEFEVQ